MAEKPTERQHLLRLAADAQKLLQEFIRLPFTEPERATELLIEFDRKVAEFKRLQAKAGPRPHKARVLRLADAPAGERCSICRKRIAARKLDSIKTNRAIYHRACYVAVVVDRELRRSSP